MANYINFSHKYTKLGESKTAVLLEVIPYELAELSLMFRAYDTDNGLYALPKSGSYLILVFQRTNDQQIFTTLRRYDILKERYYRSLIGKELIIIIGQTTPKQPAEEKHVYKRNIKVKCESGLHDPMFAPEGTEAHHKFSQSTWARKLYGDLLDHPKNIQHLCYNCHHDQPLIKWSEIDFCQALGIEPQSKEAQSRMLRENNLFKN